jgi:FtsZ-binding cell division protein ZapB
MNEETADRLAVLEEHVQRAIALIASLRAEISRLVQERATGAARLDELEAEASALRARVSALARIESDHRRLLDERRQLLSQVEAILKDLARIEGL